MIEREFIKEKIKYHRIKEDIREKVGLRAGCGSIEIEKTPLGEKIRVIASRPGMVIGRRGQTISELTAHLKEKYKLENPQIEVIEATTPFLSSKIAVNSIVSDLERFGTSRFKAIGYNTLKRIMESGALGAEIHIGGRGVPGKRAKTWRFAAGYMKKCGNVSEEIDRYMRTANIKSGSVGVKVAIMLPDTNLPDKVKLKFEDVKIEEIVPKSKEEKEVQEVKKAEVKAPEEKPKKETTKKEETNKLESKENKPAKKSKPKKPKAEKTEVKK